jgi:hypothetical protein
MARRLDVPVETAKTRVKRGLARLRERLEPERDDDRRSFLAGLLLLIDGPEATPPAVYAAAGILAAAVLVTSVALLSIPGSADPAPVPRVDEARERAGPATAPNAADPDGDPAKDASARPAFLEVRVREAISGLPVHGAEVRSGSEVFAAEEGTARLPYPAGPVDLLVDADGYYGKRVRERAAASPVEVDLVPETRVGYVNRIEGRVETADGSPAPDSFVLLERGDGLVDMTRADSEGRFVARFPISHWGLTVRAHHPRHGEGAERLFEGWVGLQAHVRYVVVQQVSTTSMRRPVTSTHCAPFPRHLGGA